MKKIFVVFGTRPEVLKLAPVIKKIIKGHNFFRKPNPFGDGKASNRIVRFIENKLVK